MGWTWRIEVAPDQQERNRAPGPLSVIRTFGQLYSAPFRSNAVRRMELRLMETWRSGTAGMDAARCKLQCSAARGKGQ
jgi:hypothetical protein